MALFRERLRDASRKNNSLLCVGLDPDPEKMAGRDILTFNKAIVDATTDLVCAYKPNFAFYEAAGLEGLRALIETIDYIGGRVPVIADAKRGDIGNSDRFYAQALFNVYHADAATVSPFLGYDSLQPFLEHTDRGILLLCRTSNPGARDFQDLTVDIGGRSVPLYEAVALKAQAWDTEKSLGLVTGATYPAEIRRVRGICPDMPLLVPGVGVQQAELEAAVQAAVDRQGEMAIINASRSILYASVGKDFAEAARVAAQELREKINAARAKALAV